MDLFKPDAPWKQASQHVRVFKLTFGFVMRSTDENLIRVFRELDQRHIALALEAGLLSGHDGCGKGVEGYAAPLTAKVVSERIRKLGGNLQYLAMDEPLWYGHHFDGPTACHSTMREISQEIATRLADLRAVFPNVQVGDIEPVGAKSDDWVPQIVEFADVYREVVGEPLAFFHADIAWDGPWQEQLLALQQHFQKMNIPFGIIYDGSNDKSNQEWTDHAVQKAVTIEHEMHLQPDMAILQTWQQFPTHLLPETQPGTMTNFVLMYCAKPTNIQVTRSDNSIVGRLIELDGKPVGGNEISLRTSGGDKITTPVVRKVTGQVPDGATTATIGLRIDQSGSAGPMVVRLGSAQYTDNRSGQSLVRNFQPPNRTFLQGERIVVPVNQKLSINTQPFPVTTGDPYTFAVPTQIFQNSGARGNVDIIFLGPSHKQVSYQPIPLDNRTESRVIARTRTDSDGRFSFAASEFGEFANVRCFLQSSGNTTNRMAKSEPFVLQPRANRND